jgi:hypothetical protein
MIQGILTEQIKEDKIMNEQSFIIKYIGENDEKK